MILILVFLLGTARADDVPPDSTQTDPTTPVSQSHAEYVRLSEEIEKLAQRNAWPGVEKLFQELLATGEAPSFDDWIIGAHSARATGDIGAARERLYKANEIREEREVLDTLWEIDSNYGKVWLAGDLGRVEFKCDQMPFEPDAAQAVTFAQTRVAETGMFSGYLPQGDYWFGEQKVSVQPRVQEVRIDLRTDDPKPVKKKKEKKKKKTDEVAPPAAG